MLKSDHNPNFASERTHPRRKIGGTKRWGMLSAYRGCCSALLSFNHSIRKCFTRLCPPGRKPIFRLSLLLVMSKDVLLVSTHRKKQQKTWNPTRATSISKIMLLDTFLWVPYDISWGYIQELNKTLPFKYVWISRASYIFIWFKLYSKFACFWWSTVDQMVDIRVSARHLRWSCSCRSESTKALLAQFAKAGGSTRLKGDDHMIYI